MYEIFEKLLKAKGVTAYQVSKATGIPQATFSQWKHGVTTPKVDKLRLIADYFNVSLEYLMNEDENENYYINDEVAELAQEIYEDEDLHMLFSAARDISKEDMQYVVDLVKRLKETNPDG